MHPTRKTTITLLVSAVVLFLISASGQDNGYWKHGPKWLGAIGWFGFLVCLLLLIASGAYALTMRSRKKQKP